MLYEKKQLLKWLTAFVLNQVRNISKKNLSLLIMVKNRKL